MTVRNWRDIDLPRRVLEFLYEKRLSRTTTRHAYFAVFAGTWPGKSEVPDPTDDAERGVAWDDVLRALRRLGLIRTSRYTKYTTDVWITAGGERFVRFATPAQWEALKADDLLGLTDQGGPGTMRPHPNHKAGGHRANGPALSHRRYVP